MDYNTHNDCTGAQACRRQRWLCWGTADEGFAGNARLHRADACRLPVSREARKSRRVCHLDSNDSLKRM